MPNYQIVTKGFKLWWLYQFNFDGFTTFWGEIWIRPNLSIHRLAQVTRHEREHWRQICEEGRIKFAVKYTYYTIRGLIKYGSLFEAYWNNPYEKQAREKAGELI